MSDQPPVPPTQPTPVPPPPPPGSATWQGVQPVVERPTEIVPPVPPPGPPPAPPGPGGGGAGGGGGNGKVIAIVLVIVAILGVGGFLLLSGGDDDDGGDVATERTRDDRDDEDETTTTTEAEEETTTSTTEAEETTTSAVDDTTPPGGGDLAFTGISDDSGQLTVEVPDTWTDVDGSSLGDGAPNVQASTDLASFRQLGASGISFTLLNQQNADPDTTLDFLTAGQVDSCEAQPRQDYTDGVFTGRLQQLDNCGGQGITLITIVASNPAGQSVEVSTIIVPPDPVQEIEQQIIDTFNVQS